MTKWLYLALLALCLLSLALGGWAARALRRAACRRPAARADAFEERGPAETRRTRAHPRTERSTA